MDFDDIDNLIDDLEEDLDIKDEVAQEAQVAVEVAEKKRVERQSKRMTMQIEKQLDEAPADEAPKPAPVVVGEAQRLQMKKRNTMIMEQPILVKVSVPSLSITEKIIKCDRMMTIAQVGQRIKSKTKYPKDDHGVFQAENLDRFLKAMWLPRDATLASVEATHVKDETDKITLVYKSRYTTFQVGTMDNTTRALDLDVTVSLLNGPLLTIAKAYDLDPAIMEYYTLCAEVLQHVGVDPYTHITLNHEDTLYGTDPQQRLLLRRIYFSPDLPISSPEEIDVLYRQFHTLVISDEFPVTQNEAVHFAALHAQVLLGEYDPLIHKLPNYKANMKAYLSSKFQKNPAILKDVMKEHEHMKGVKDAVAKKKYIDMIKQTGHMETVFLNVRETEGKGNQCVLAINPKETSVLSDLANTRHPVNHFPMSSLKRWASSTQAFIIQFDADRLSVRTGQGLTLSNLLGMFLNINKRITPSLPDTVE